MILVVDDDHTIVQLLKEMLEKDKYEVRTAHDGAAAYTQIRDTKCRGVILDMMMPKINGAELLMLMAADRIHVPVIVIAGSPDFDQDEMRQFPNVKQLLHKPFYPEDVLAAVRQHFGKK
jgi:two-component system response regulator CpxR